MRQGPGETAELGLEQGHLSHILLAKASCKASPDSRCGEISYLEGMSCNVTLQRVWLGGHFCNRSTLGTLITNEASALILCPQKVTLLGPLPFGVGTVGCGVRAGWALYLKCLWEDVALGQS